MTEIPKLKCFTGPYEDKEHYVCSKERDEKLTEAQATEIIRRTESYPQIIDLLRYFYNLPCDGISLQSRHNEMLEKAEQVLKEKPK